MKHTLKITLMLLSLFILTQVIGLVTIAKYIQLETITTDTGEQVTQIVHDDTAIGPVPEVENRTNSFIYITIAILVGTLLLLILIRFRLKFPLKIWFFLAIFLSLTVSFGVYITNIIAFILAFILALWRIIKPNPYIHNLTEIFIYTGITILLINILNILSISILLLIISVYDIYAVWKSKHMVKLAKYQSENKMFAGLLIEYGKKTQQKITKPKKPTTKAKSSRHAILGGGDIAFPLIFTAVVFEEYLIKTLGLSKLSALLNALIITLCVTLALALLFIKGEKNKFYPAMPFLTIGCFVGLAIVWLVNLI